MTFKTYLVTNPDVIYCMEVIENPCSNALSGTSSELFLSLIKTIMATQCALDPKQFYPEDYNCKKETFDFIIVGGGTAGSVLANRLTENPNWNILLIEGGGLPSSNNEIPAMAFDQSIKEQYWNYTTVSPGMCLGFENRKCTMVRGKILGGCSAINAMLYTRGRKQDYDNWERAGNTGWDWDSVKKYFRKAENLNIQPSATYGIGGPVNLSHYDFPRKIRTSIYNAATELGYLVSKEEPDLGYYECIMTISNGQRCSNAKAYISKIIYRENLFLSTNTVVDKLLINKTTKTITGVKISDGKCGVNYKLYAQKEVILSAGSIGSPEILLKSDIGPEKCIANIPVGKNLIDHLMIFGLVITLNDSAADQIGSFDDLDAVYHYFTSRSGPLTTLDMINVLGFIDTTKQSTYPDVEIMHLYFSKNDTRLEPSLTANKLNDVFINKLMSINKDYCILLIMPILLKPKSLGEVILKQNKIEIHPKYLNKKEDVKKMLNAIEYVKKFIKTSAMRALDANFLEIPLPILCGDLGSPSYWNCLLHYYAGTAFNLIGTCKMGHKLDKTAVVSPTLNVYGVNRLRVVDVSVIPTPITAHSNAPTTMVAEKAADIIKEAYGII